jgi:hypothetical protein
MVSSSKKHVNLLMNDDDRSGGCRDVHTECNVDVMPIQAFDAVAFDPFVFLARRQIFFCLPPMVEHTQAAK